jgi:hypothetical protein
MCCSICFRGGIQACGIAFGALAQAARTPGLPVDTQNSMALELSRHGKKAQRAGGPVTNLPSLNAETWDGRCSFARGTFDHFRSTQLYSHMTNGPLSKMANRGRATVSLAVMAAHRVGLCRVRHGKTARNFVFALGRTPLRPQGHVCVQIRSLAHEFPVAEATTTCGKYVSSTRANPW